MTRSPAGGFLDGLDTWAASDTATTPLAFRDGLLRQLRAAQAERPTSALVHQLAARALAVTDTGLARGDGVPDLRRSLALSCAVERDDLAAQQAAVARTAAALVTGRESWIAAGPSTTVRDALLELHRRGRAPRALVAEGRPRLEGRALAAALAAAGVPVWIVVDAALPLLVSQAAGIWIGAAAVTDRGVLTRIGAFAVALAAREHGVAVHALAVRRKLLPAATPALRIPEEPGAEVWADPPEGVRPRNVQLELVPLELLRGVVVEDEVLGASEIRVAVQDRALPAELGGGGATAA